MLCDGVRASSYEDSEEVRDVKRTLQKATHLHASFNSSEDLLGYALSQPSASNK